MNNQVKIIKLINEYKDDKELKEICDAHLTLRKMIENNVFDKIKVYEIYKKYENEILNISSIRKNVHNGLNIPFEEYDKNEILLTQNYEFERKMVECLCGILVSILTIKFVHKYYCSETEKNINNLSSNDFNLIYEIIKQIIG